MFKHFADRAFEHLGDKHLDKLAEQIAEQRKRIGFIEARMARDEESWTGLQNQERLDRIELPRLAALEASRFAISLPELLELVRSDETMATHDEEFQREMFDGFGHVLHGKDILYKNELIEDWFEGETEHWSAEERDMFNDTWLMEADLDELADSYTWRYFYPDGPGYAEIEALPDPVHDALWITDAEHQAFFEAFSLANGKIPH